MQCKPILFKDTEVFPKAPTNTAIVQIVIPPRATGGQGQNSSGRMTKELLCVAVPLRKRSKGRPAVEIAAVAIPRTRRPMGSWRHFGDYAVLEPRVPAAVPVAVPGPAAVPAVVLAVVLAVVPAAEDILTDEEDVEPPPNDEVPNPSEDSADKEAVLEPPPNDEAPNTFGDSPDEEAVLEPSPNDEVSTPSENGANEEPVPKKRKGGRRPKKRPRRPIITTGRSCAQVLKEAEEEGRRNGPPPIDPTWRITPDPVAARNAAAQRPQNRATEAELREIDEFLEAARAKKRSAYIRRRAWKLLKEKKERLSRLGKQVLDVFLAWRRKQS
jgi:hypothetical protein